MKVAVPVKPKAPVAAAPVPPIITKSRGIAYNVQNTYANWQQGMRKR